MLLHLDFPVKNDNLVCLCRVLRMITSVEERCSMFVKCRRTKLKASGGRHHWLSVFMAQLCSNAPHNIQASTVFSDAAQSNLFTVNWVSSTAQAIILHLLCQQVTKIKVERKEKKSRL